MWVLRAEQIRGICIQTSRKIGSVGYEGIYPLFSCLGDWLQVWASVMKLKSALVLQFHVTDLNMPLFLTLEISWTPSWTIACCCHQWNGIPINMMAIEVTNIDCWLQLDVQDMLWPCC